MQTKFQAIYGLVQYKDGRSLPASGRCELCRTKSVGFDHCHKHGWIRGELCSSHNIRMKLIDSRLRSDKWEPWMIRLYILCPGCKFELIEDLFHALMQELD